MGGGKKLEGLLFYSRAVLLRLELDQTFMVFRKSGACYPQQSALKPPKLALCVSPHQRLVGCKGSVSFANVTVTSGVPRPCLIAETVGTALAGSQGPEK